MSQPDTGHRGSCIYVHVSMGSRAALWRSLENPHELRDQSNHSYSYMLLSPL